jgi:hypothetical protein
MKTMICVALMGFVLVLCTGCAATAPRVAKAVNIYCLEPQLTRQMLRENLAAMIAPNKLEVTCAGDLE